MHVRATVNSVNIGFIILAGGAGVSHDRETEFSKKSRPGRLALNMLSVPVEGKGFIKT